MNPAVEYGARQVTSPMASAGSRIFSEISREPFVLLTPRFRTSRHLILVLLDKVTGTPDRIVKVSRFADDGAALQAEASNLEALERACPVELRPTVPRLLALEKRGGHSFLIQSAVCGRAMAPSVVRAQPDACIAKVVDWVTHLHSVRPVGNCCPSEDIENEWADFANAFPWTPDEEKSVESTFTSIRKLRGLNLPVVFEHGDLSHPNLLVMPDGKVGVLDWELAAPHGLPALDLFFFLAYVSFARSRASKPVLCCAAFEDAFFGSKSWARAEVRRYAATLQLRHDVLIHLFVLCWSRYLARLFVRARTSPSTVSQGPSVSWLRGNKYFAVWRSSLAHFAELDFSRD